MYESILNENPAAIAAAQRMVVQNKVGSKVSVNTARQSSYAKKDPSAHKKAKSMWQRIKDRFSKKEGVNEAKDPDVIAQIRDVLKKGYSSVKDPVSGKKMKVDTYTASAITQVYDAINLSNKKKFVKLPLLKMQKIAMKFVK